MVAILMMWAKLATLGLLKIKVTWDNSYDVISFVHDVTNSILCYSNYTVDVVILPKFGNSGIFMTSYNQFYKGFIRKTNYFEGCSLFKFNNLELALSMALKFYTSVVKKLEL